MQTTMDTSSKGTMYGQCRCCLAYGHHRDIMKEYSHNGVREAYYEIFMHCFNLFLSTNVNMSTLICRPCILRLRDANTFRALVVDTERQLMAAIQDDQPIFVNVDEQMTPELDIKAEPETVKEEPEVKTDFDDWDADSLGDEPLSRLKSSKAEDELVEGAAKLIARYAPIKPLPTRDSLYSIYPAFARQLDSVRGKIITGKMIEKLLEESENKKKSRHTKRLYLSEKVANITNATTLLENSTLTPFKSRNRTGFPCFYCRQTLENLDKLREHQTLNHKKSELRQLLGTYGVESLVVYVDTTDLKCTICDQSILNVNELKTHLTKVHGKVYHTEFPDKLVPFKLSEDLVFECQICGFRFETFGSIERHMNVHYRNYVCKECGSGFVTKYRLKVHVKSMHLGGHFPCELCNKVFSSQQKLKNHNDTVHKNVKRFKCPKCPERFTEYFRRQKHLVVVHGVAPLQYKCNVCDKAFDRRYTLSRHLKRDHLEQRDYQCEMCPYSCFTNNELRVHMIKHNGERIYECSVCKKSYARKKTLKEHMRIHNNDRRFACGVCGQAFVQKCSLKSHTKTHHVEYALH